MDPVALTSAARSASNHQTIECPRARSAYRRPIDTHIVVHWNGDNVGGPLEGIKVLDFTWALAGPFGAMILADLGAEVWKIETPFQNETRRGNGPWVHDVSTYFFSVNRGKKSIMLDLKAPEAKEIVHRLVQHVDVLTENFSPGTMERLGFGDGSVPRSRGRGHHRAGHGRADEHDRPRERPAALARWLLDRRHVRRHVHGDRRALRNHRAR
jgi:hypothetical protein